MVPDDAHPEAPYPLLFVCSSINASAECTSRDSDVTEAELLLNQVSKFVNAWPEREWMECKLETICVMTTSSNQVSGTKQYECDCDVALYVDRKP